MGSSGSKLLWMQSQTGLGQYHIGEDGFDLTRKMPGVKYSFGNLWHLEASSAAWGQSQSFQSSQVWPGRGSSMVAEQAMAASSCGKLRGWSTYLGVEILLKNPRSSKKKAIIFTCLSLIDYNSRWKGIGSHTHGISSPFILLPCNELT